MARDPPHGSPIKLLSLGSYSTLNIIKGAVVIECLILTLTVLTASSANQLFPWIQGGALLGVVTALGFYYLTTNRPVTLVLLISVSVWYKAIQLLIVPGTVGKDPRRYALRTQQVIDSGTIEVLPGFYGDAPLYILYQVAVSLIGGVLAETGAVMYALMFGVVSPLIAFWLATAFAPKSKGVAGIAAAAIITVGTISTHYGFWPLPQLLSTVYWYLFIVAVWQYIRTTDWRYLILLFLTLLGQLYTHKFTLLLCLGFTAIVAIVESTMRRWVTTEDSATLRNTVLVPALLTGTLLMFQWVFVTGFGPVVLSKIAVFFEMTTATVGTQQTATVGTQQTFHGATPVLSPLADVVVQKGGSVALLGASGIAWLGLALKKWKRSSARIVLTATAVGVIPLIVPLFRRGLLPFSRVFLSLELLLAVVVGTAVTMRVSRPSMQRLFRAVVVLIVITQFVTAPIAPDHPGNVQYYTTESEQSALSFASGYYPDTILTDQYYGRTILSTENQVVDSGQEVRIRAGPFDNDNTPYLNGSITSTEHPYVAYRTSVRNYQGNEVMQLTYEPEVVLDGTAHRTYDGGSVILYAK